MFFRAFHPVFLPSLSCVNWGCNRLCYYFFSSDSPVLWIRLDADMQLIRRVDIEQPDFQWQYQLRFERDVTAQIEAINSLRHHATPETRLALTDIIDNDQAFYRVRCQAAYCLTKVCQ